MSYVEHCAKHGQYKGDYCGDCIEAKDARIAELEVHESQLENEVTYWAGLHKQATERVFKAECEATGHWKESQARGELAIKLGEENARLRRALEQISFLGSGTPAVSTLKRHADEALKSRQVQEIAPDLGGSRKTDSVDAASAYPSDDTGVMAAGELGSRPEARRKSEVERSEPAGIDLGAVAHQLGVKVTQQVCKECGGVGRRLTPSDRIIDCWQCKPTGEDTK